MSSPYQDRVAQVLRETAESFSPDDVTALVQAGAVRGRRRQRRRRAAAVTGAGALVLAVAGTTALPGLIDGERHGQATTHSAPIGPTRAQVLAAFEHILPRGTVSQVRSTASLTPTTDTPPFVLSSLILDDGSGQAGFTLAIAWVGAPATRGSGCAILPPDGPCTVSRIPGLGTLTLVQDSGGHDDHWVTSKLWGAQLQLANGEQLTVTENNGSAAPGAFSGPTRNDPPLSMAALGQALKDPVWRPVLAAFPTQAELQRAQTPARLRAGLAVLNRLLPKGVTASDPTLTGGHVQEFLSGGGSGGPGLIDLQLPVWGWTDGQMWPMIGGKGTFKGGQDYLMRLGTSTSNIQEYYYVIEGSWTSGRQVEIIEYNSRSTTAAAADRTDPVLTPAELKTVIGSPLWQTLPNP